MDILDNHTIYANQVFYINNQVTDSECGGIDETGLQTELSEIMDEDGLVLSATSVYEYDLSCLKKRTKRKQN